MKHLKTFEYYNNYYQGSITVDDAIEKARNDFNLAMKQGNEGQADKILGNLKTYLDSVGYNWKTDPITLELLGDYID